MGELAEGVFHSVGFEKKKLVGVEFLIVDEGPFSGKPSGLGNVRWHVRKVCRVNEEEGTVLSTGSAKKAMYQLIGFIGISLVLSSRCGNV